LPTFQTIEFALAHGSGSQALEALGGQLTGTPSFVQATASVPLSYSASNSIVTLDAFAQLAGPSTNTGSGTADDLVSVNLEAILSDGSYFSTYLSSDGQAYAYTTNYDFSAPAALGQYHELQLTLDFPDRTSTFSVDGRILGTLPFDPSVTSDVLSSAQFTMYAVSSSVDPASYTAQIDDFAVSAVPEPSSLLLALTGICGGSACFVGRRRLSCSRNQEIIRCRSQDGPR